MIENRSHFAGGPNHLVENGNDQGDAPTSRSSFFLRRMSGMQMDEGDARLLLPLTERIIGCAFRVANALGHGFTEKIYESALAPRYESPGRCGSPVQQWGSVVFYDDVIVSEFTADLLIENFVIVALKVVGAPSDVHIPQYRNYLRATGKRCAGRSTSAGPKSKSAASPPFFACPVAQP